MSYNYEFAKPDSTASVIAYTSTGIGVIICAVVRAKDPFKGQLALPGGFIETTVRNRDLKVSDPNQPAETIITNGETLEDCAVRELREETGLTIFKSKLRIISVQSDPNRDPRGHVIDHVYAAQFPISQLLEATAGDDALAIRFVPFTALSNNTEYDRFAFDHGLVLKKWLKDNPHLIPQQQTGN